MLRGIHKASSSWLGKGVLTVIMGLLVISFAIWGIGDIFRGFGARAVAKIGSTEISIEQFRAYYNDRLQQLSRRLGRPITPDQARALGLDKQLIGQLVAETTLDERARQLRLGIANAEISRRITGDPTFHSITGQFDRSRFEQMIRQAGYTETTYVNEQRQLTLRRQIAMSVSGDIIVPDAALAAFSRFQNERRSADLIVLGPPQAGDVPAATPEALAKYFEERKTAFRAPETRKLTLLILSPAEQARWSVIPDAEAKAYYDANTAEFGAPERRQLRQIVFPNAEDARAASERLKAGLSFDDLAKERNLSDGDVDLGTVTKTAVIDPAVAEAAFALPQGQASAPVQGRFGTVIVQAKAIEPAAQKTFDAVADQIKRTVADNRAKSEINALRDKIEDERAGGSSLAETAKKLNLTSRAIEAIDRSGRAPGGGHVWFEVMGISPSRERALEEVKDQVAARWRDDETAARIKQKADELIAKLKAGTPLAQLAAENNLTVESVGDLQRTRAGDKVPQRALDAIFRASKGVPGTAEGAKPTERVLFLVTDITEPKRDPASPEAKALADTLRRGYGEDLIGQYVARLESDYGVYLNQAALNQVIGGGATGQ